MPALEEKATISAPIAPLSSSSGLPAATVLHTLVLVNHTFFPGNLVPQNATIPSAIAYDAKDNKLFVASWGGAVPVINSTINQLAGLISVGTAYAVAYDARNGEAYVTVSASGKVVTIDAATDQLKGSITVGKQPDGVTVDSANGNIYVANSGSNNVSVIAGATDKVTGSIPVGTTPVYVAVDSTNGELFVTNYNSDNVTILNAATHKVIGSTAVGIHPGGITFDPANGDIYVVDAGMGSPSNPNGDVSVLDGSTGNVLTTVPVGACPWGAAYDSQTQEVYVTDTTCTQLGAYVSVINATTNKLVATVGVGSYPFAVTYDSSNGLLYTANAYSDNLTILNGSSRKAVGSVGVGEMPSALAYDPSNRLMYVANWGGNDVVVVNGTTGAELRTIAVGYGPDGLAYDTANEDLYVANSLSNNITVVDTRTNLVVASIPVGAYPQGLAYDGANGDVYVANCNSNSVSIIDGFANTVASTVGAGTCPSEIAYDFANRHLYVTNQGSKAPAYFYDGNVTVIDGATNRVAGSIIAGGGPHGVAYDPANGYVYVANYYYPDLSDNNLTVIDGATDRAIGSISLGLGVEYSPWGLAYDSARKELLVTMSYVASDLVEAVDATTGRVLGTTTVGLWPWAVTMNQATGDAWVANYLSGTVSLLNVTAYPPPRYPITFEETGLSAGTSWSVTCNLTTNSSTFSTVGFSEPTGNYTFTVSNVSGYLLLSPASGTVDLRSSGDIILVRFDRFYSVTFDETGLLVGTSWSIVWNGSTLLAPGTSLSLSATNGSYAFTIPTAEGYIPIPANGTLQVNGSDWIQSVRFSPPPAPAPRILDFTAKPGRGSIPTTFTFRVSVSGGATPLSYAYFGLPVGTGCASANNSELFCSPKVAGNFTVEIIVTDSLSRNVTANTSIQVTESITTLPPGTSPPIMVLGLPLAEGAGLISGIAVAVVIAGMFAWRRFRVRTPLPKSPGPDSHRGA